MGAGPERLLEAGIDGALSKRGHRVRTTFIELPRDAWSSEISSAFELMRRVTAAIAANRECLPILLAGNCNTTIGALAAHAPRTGIVWFDAHADFNTPDTTISGFLDGTALSTVTGRSWRQLALTVPGFRPLPEESVCVVGARDLDPLERHLLSESGVTLVGAADIRSALPGAIESISSWVDSVHVHIDLDVIDASVARANSYAVEGGLTIEDMEFSLALMAQKLTIAGITLSAYDPAGDADGRAAAAAIRLVCAAASTAGGA
jgi:arginase